MRRKMKMKYNLIYALLIVSIAEFFVIFDVAIAIDIDQLSQNQLREALKSNRDLKTKIHFLTEKHNSKKIDNEKVNQLYNNLRNVKHSNLYPQNPHSFKFPFNVENKLFGNLFNNYKHKVTKKGMRIKRQVNKNIRPNVSDKEVLKRRAFDSKDRKIFRVKKSTFGNENIVCDCKDHVCKKIYYPMYYIRNINCRENANTNAELQPFYPQNSNPPIYLNDNLHNVHYNPYEIAKYENDNDYHEININDCVVSHTPTFCASISKNDENFEKKKSESKDIFKYESKQAHSFQELSIREQSILKEAVNKVLKDYSSTLRHNFNIENLKNFSTTSRAEEMLASAIKGLLLSGAEENSVPGITDEIIKSALKAVINDCSKNNLCEVRDPTEAPTTPKHKNTLIPIAEVNLKIGQWLEENKGEGNTLDIETQIIPSIRNPQTNSGVSLTVSPLKTKFSVGVKNPEGGIDKLPIEYYSPTDRQLEYIKSHQDQHYSGTNHFIQNYDNLSRNIMTANGFQGNPSSYSNGQNVYLNSERKIQEEEQHSEASKSKTNSKSENTFHNTSDGRNGKSDVYQTSKQEESSESDMRLNSTKNRNVQESTQFRGLSRNKKHSLPGGNFNESSERNINKNPRIVGLLVNDQNSQPNNQHFFPAADQIINENSERKTGYKINENLSKVSNQNINKNNTLFEIPSRFVNIVNDFTSSSFIQKSGFQKNGKTDPHEINEDRGFQTDISNRKNITGDNLNTSRVLNVSKLSTKAEDDMQLKAGDMNHHRDSGVLGLLMPQNKENSEFKYVGNTLKLPLQLRKLKDGSFSVLLSNKNPNSSSQNNCSINLPPDQHSINKRDTGDGILKKNDSKVNLENEELNTIATSSEDSKENFTSTSKEHVELVRDESEEYKHYKQYVETLLDVNDIPKKDRSYVVVDAMEKMHNNDISNPDVNKKDRTKNSLMLEKLKSKKNVENIKVIDCLKDSKCNRSTGIDILKVILSWLSDVIFKSFK